MRKKFGKLLLCFTFCLCLILTGCKGSDANYINISRYFNDSVTITEYGSINKTDLSLENTISTKELKQYTSFKFTGQKKWISDLFVKSISLGFASNKNVTIDATMRIYDLANNGPETKLDETLDQYYNEYAFSLDLISDAEQKYTFEIDNYFKQSANVIIVIKIDENCYTQFDKLKIGLASFNIDAKHE
ncbi:MAG: hypothetical protein ACI4T8_01225 [Christensenellales bacterium]